MNVYEILQADNYKCAFRGSDDDTHTHSLNFASTAAKPIATICDKCLAIEQKYRRKQEKDLLQGNTGEAIQQLGYSQFRLRFKKMSMLYSPKTMADIIEWMLEDESFLQQIAKLYFEDMERRKNEQSDDLPF